MPDPRLALLVAILFLVLRAAPTPAQITSSTGPADLLKRYATGDFAAADLTSIALEDLPAFVSAFERVTAGEPAVLAAFALEAAESLVRTPRRILSRRLLAVACERMRARPGTAQGEAWVLASVAWLQRAEDWDALLGTGGSGELEHGHLAHATALAPRDVRLRLAAVIADEGRTWSAVTGRWRVRAQPGPAGLTSALERIAGSYEALSSTPAIAPEAALRRGVTLFELGQPDAAAYLEAAELSRVDPTLRHIGLLVRAQLALASRDQIKAVKLLQSSLELVPRAQSATALLASLLQAGGRPDEAAGYVEDLFTQVTLDPRRAYEIGDGRFWEDHLHALRKSIK